MTRPKVVGGFSVMLNMPTSKSSWTAAMSHLTVTGILSMHLKEIWIRTFGNQCLLQIDRETVFPVEILEEGLKMRPSKQWSIAHLNACGGAESAASVPIYLWARTCSFGPNRP